ncbi:acyltransferase [Archangium sp.]|jgi:peptidoglycan/LPS O-acetylase OafA/YrhL|uniref:acyltransferase family protein n=1 Tax=Archangium sp. TaxID=1872627 RepID=UPI002ED89EA5
MIRGLDGLRAIAFLLVFFFHAAVLKCGWLGVQLFFVLSGFLITRILVASAGKVGQREYFVRFYGRRALRIFPLYFLYILCLGFVCVLLVDYGGYREVKTITNFIQQIPYALTYTYNFFHASSAFVRTPLVTHFWSLAIEEQFYLLWPAVIFFTPKRKHLGLFALAVAVGPVLRAGTALAFKHHLIPFQGEDVNVAIYVLSPSHLDAFAMGALMTQWRVPKARLQWVILALLLPIVGFATTAGGPTLASLSSLGYPMGLAGAFKPIWGYTAWNYFFGLTIYCIARNEVSVRALEWRPLAYLGKISYGLYVYHFGVIGILQTAARHVKTDVDLVPLMAFPGLAISIVIAAASYRFIEQPALKLKDVLFPTGSAPEASPHSEPISHLSKVTL